MHYENKFVELLDTCWMVLRHKRRQVQCSRHSLSMRSAVLAQRRLLDQVQPWPHVQLWLAC